ILADEMGLGKTIQMIATINLNPPIRGEPIGTLIVCPLSVLKQWRTEIETKSTSDVPPLVYHGEGRIKSHLHLQMFKIVLTTYHTLAMELPTQYMLKLDDHPDGPMRDDKCGPLLRTRWHRIVFDEAQILRNSGTRMSSAAARLKSTIRWCLTGTPIINRLEDAFPLIRILRIPRWYKWRHFDQNIVQYEDKDPKLATKRLQRLFRTCLLRRNKSSTLDGKCLIELPSKHVQLVTLDFSKEERAIYSAVEGHAQVEFNRFLRQGTVLKNHSHVFSLLLRLRQCACHPGMRIHLRGCLRMSDGLVQALIQEEFDEDMVLAQRDRERRAECERARLLVSKSFVESIKEGLLQTARERMKLEQTARTSSFSGGNALMIVSAVSGR
ncbi:hypothetical protein CALCODRAFT_427408, partial [Calocera cornea HHB12733]